MIPWLIPVYLFVFGLCIGSFLNVVILRYRPERSAFALMPLTGRSHCMACGKTLAWYELLPVISFLIQRGRCRSCRINLSAQYPLVELLTGFIFLTPLYFYDPFMRLYSLEIGWLWVLAFLAFLVIAAIDYYWMIIPDELNLFLVALGFGRIALEQMNGTFGAFTGSFAGSFAALFGFRNDVAVNHIAGAAIGVLLIGVIILVTRGRGMGVGDLKLAGALGFLFGWPDIGLLLMFAFVLGSLYGVYVLLAHTKRMKDAVPFGPFIILGALTLMFYGKQLLDLYFRIFS